MKRLMPILLLIVGCAHTPAARPAASAKLPTTDDRLEAMTKALEHEDFAAALAGTDEWLAVHKESWEPELIANCRTWIRWAAGDKKRALEENEKLRALAGDDEKGHRSALLHYWWDRAYLLAEAGRHDEADAARAEFDRLGNRDDDKDSRKTLEAWLRLMRGDGAGAWTAAEAVDVAKDGDLQDLYVIARALEAGGDAAAAERLRAKIRNGSRYPMKPLILRAMKQDAARGLTLG